MTAARAAADGSAAMGGHPEHPGEYGQRRGDTVVNRVAERTGGLERRARRLVTRGTRP
jgi:hypothetical protein